MLGALTVSILFITSTLDGFQALDEAGEPLAEAQLTFWRSGTTAKQAIYADQGLTDEHDNPLTADADGRFPLIYLGEDNDYRIKLKTADGVLRWDVDPYICDCTDPPYVFRTPIHQAVDDDAAPLPGATLTFSATETTTPKNTYADADKKVPHPNPLKADAGGYFPPVYMDDSITYRVILDHDGTELLDIDPYVCACGFKLLTSRPYALEVVDTMDITGGIRKGGFPPTLFETVDISGTLFSATLKVALLSYDNYQPESIDIDGTVLSGTLVSKLKSYDNYQPEEIDIAGTIQSGTLVDKLLTYANYAPESIDIDGTILSGTLADSATRETFTESGTFNVPAGVSSVDVLVVAGGGGGGHSNNGGAGGGAGGLIFEQSFAVTPEAAIAVTVGAGGAGGASAGSSGTNGGNSVFDSLTAVGGGGGSGASGTPGSDGGSAGGGAGGGAGADGPGGSGTLNQGSDGGDGFGGALATRAAGGGGGAGGVGGNASSGTAGTAGTGMDNNISGATVTYASGGAGNKQQTPGAGAAGQDGRGNGGGGGAASAGGDGGSGIVIVRYQA